MMFIIIYLMVILGYITNTNTNINNNNKYIRYL